MEAITIHRKNSKPKAKGSQKKPFLSHLRLFHDMWTVIEDDVEDRWTELLRETSSALTTQLQHEATIWASDKSSRSQLSAAVLQLGGNTPDHVRLLRRVRRAVTSRVTPHVVSLRSSLGAMPSLMRYFVKKLVPADFLRRLNLSAPLKASFHAVVSWYSSTKQDRPIVVLLEDCDAFAPRALQDLVTVSCCYAKELPLQLVLGVASHMGVLHSLLGGVASSRLRLHIIKTPSPAEFRRRVLEPALTPTADCPVRLGPQLRSFLLDVLFRRLDFASHSFFRRLKLCLLEHVLRLDATVVTGMTAALQGKSGKAAAEAFRLIESSERAAAFATWLSRLLRADLSSAACGPGGLAAAELFRSAMSAWLRSSPQQLTSDLEAGLETLPEALGDAPEILELQSQLAGVLSELRNACEEARPAMFQMEAKMSLKALRAGLKEHQQQQRPADRLAALLRRHLEAAAASFCPDFASESPLFFDDVAVVRGLLNPSQRADLQIALSRPSVYFCAEGVQDEEASVLSPRSPDLSILFKLHLECPHYINLYDWLQAFAAVLGEDLNENAAPSRTVQARFAQGVAELQFLGLIKATSRKTDHVARLTWGTC